MNLSELIENKVSESIVWRGKKLDVVFVPERVTAKERDAIASPDLSEEERERLTIEFLVKAIDSWSLTDVEPTYETLSREDFPHVLKMHLVDRLIYQIQNAAGKFKALKN